MEVLNVEKTALSCRKFTDVKTFVKTINKTFKCWSWGARAWTIYPNNMALRFRVSGHLHKGYVFIFVNGLDLFDVYYTNLKLQIKSKDLDVHLEDIINKIDTKVERIPEYKK